MTTSILIREPKYLFFIVRKYVSTIFLFAFCSAFQTVGSAQTVQGTVTDESGKPLSSVSITVKGTSRGTITDERGSFMLSASSGEVLVVSSVGFDNKEVNVGNESNITVSLTSNNSQLAE